MEKLLVTLIPCSLVVLSLIKVERVLRAQRQNRTFSPFSLVLVAGVTAVAMLWAAVALNEAMKPGPLTPAFVDASWDLGPGLAFCFFLTLFAEDLAAGVSRLMFRSKRSK